MKFLKHPLFIVFVVLVVLFSLPLLIPKKPIKHLSDSELRKFALDLDGGMLPIPKTLEGIIKVTNTQQNPLTKEKILLGKKLFFDNRLSRDSSINCSSCHLLEDGGDDNLPTAIGVKARENPHHLNSPTVLNAALAKAQFWDGRAKDVEEQAGGPIQAHFEMDMTPKELVERLKKDETYQKKFKKVFSQDITFENIKKAIGAYERTLLTRASYDEFLDGNDTAISEAAKRGMSLFLQKGCKGCHVGMSVGGQSIQKFPLRHYLSDYIGLVFDPDTKIKTSPFPFENKGGFLGRAGDLKFRVPILRNITKTAPYFHNGAIKDIKEVVRIMSRYQLGDEFNKEQIDDVVEFLKSLEGRVVVNPFVVKY